MQPGLPPGQVLTVPAGLRRRADGSQQDRIVKHAAGALEVVLSQQFIGQSQPQFQVVRFGANDIAQVCHRQVAVLTGVIRMQHCHQVAFRKHQHQPSHDQRNHAHQRTP